MSQLDFPYQQFVPKEPPTLGPGDQPLPPLTPAQQQTLPQQPPSGQVAPPGPPAQQQAPPPPPEPLSQSETLTMQRYQQSISGEDAKLASGDIDALTHAQTTAQIKQRLAPLKQRQQAYTAYQKQQMEQQALQAAAQQEAINTVHMKVRAQDFGATVGQFTNPVTGATEYFQQDPKGGWKPIEFSDYHKHEDRRNELFQSAEARAMETLKGAAGAIPGQPMHVVMPRRYDQPMDAGPPESERVLPAAQQPPPGQAGGGRPPGPVPLAAVADQARQGQVEPPVPPEQPLRVLNAQGQDITASQMAQSLKPRGARDEWGRPIQGAEPETGGAQLSMAEYVKRANQAVPMPNLKGVAPALAARLNQARQAQVNALANHWAQRDDTARRQEANIHQRGQETRETQATQRASIEAERTLKHQERFQKVLETQLEHADKQWQEIEKHNAADVGKVEQRQMPAHLATPEARQQHALDRARFIHQQTGGEPGPGAITPPPSGATKPPSLDDLQKDIVTDLSGSAKVPAAPTGPPDTDRTAMLRDTAQAWLDTTKSQRGIGRITGLVDLLSPAVREKRGLTDAEFKKYREAHHSIKDLDADFYAAMRHDLPKSDLETIRKMVPAIEVARAKREGT
jgi:hypothetical protein